MTPFFVVHLLAFVLSLVVMTEWINGGLRRWSWIEPKYLPCFAWGWCIYCAMYLGARALVLPVEVVRTAYTLTAFGVVAIASVNWMWRRRAPLSVGHLPVDPGTLVVVGVFLAGMVAVGPYLEFPSDPLEYLYRVQAWEKVRWMDYAGYYTTVSTRFPSFVEHFLLRSSGISVGDRGGLGLLCAVMEAAFLWQFVRLGALLTGNVVWGWLAAVLSIGYFGYNAISVFSYIVLSGPLVSTMVYLEGLILVFAAFLREEWRWFLLTPPLLAFCWVSHEQGTLFLLSATSGISLLMLVFRYRALSRPFRRALVVMTTATMVPIVLFASTRPSRDWQGLASPHVATVGKVLGHHLRYHPVDFLHELLGLVGWLAMIVAAVVLLSRQTPRGLEVMAALTIWPLFILWNPLAYAVLARFLLLHTFHRLLYGCLYWVLPAVALAHMWQRWRRPGAPSTIVARSVVVTAIVLLILLSWVPAAPVYGRMRQLWSVPHPQLDGRDLQPLIAYVRTNAEHDCVDPQPDPRFRPIRRYVLSDPYVNAYLLATGYFYAATSRWQRQLDGYESPPLGVTVGLENGGDYDGFVSLLRERSVCYVILRLREVPVRSWVGAISGHWPADYASPHHYYSPRLVEWVSGDPSTFQRVYEHAGNVVYRLR